MSFIHDRRCKSDEARLESLYIIKDICIGEPFYNKGHMWDVTKLDWSAENALRFREQRIAPIDLILASEVAYCEVRVLSRTCSRECVLFRMCLLQNVSAPHRSRDRSQLGW